MNTGIHQTRFVVRTTPERSRLMARVGRINTRPELVLRQALFRAGLRFRLKTKLRLPGSPDVLFPRHRVAIFVDGCFWHGCRIHGSWPKRNKEFWSSKIIRNRQRDSAADRALRALGWFPIRIWEHSTRDQITRSVNRVKRVLESRESQ